MKAQWRRVRNFTISIGYWVGWSLCRSIRFLWRPNPPGLCMALCYHTILPGDIDAFRRQMEELLRIAVPVRADAIGRLRGRRPAVTVTFDDAYSGTVEKVVPELTARGIPCAVFVPTGYLGQRPGWEIAPDSPDRYERVVSAEQLRNLSSQLVVIGSHSVTHRDVSRQDAKTVFREFRESRLSLERVTGREVTLLALPYGRVTPVALLQARRAGYSRVFCGGPRLTGMTDADFVVGRVRVDPSDWLCEFRLKVLGAYCWLPALSRLKRTVHACFRRINSRRGKARVNTAKASYASRADLAEP